MNDLHMDLKVCEGCGALWLRPGVSGVVYCRSCQVRLAEFPAARGLRAPLRPRKPRLGLVSPAPTAPAAGKLNPGRRSAALTAGGAR